MQIEEFTTSVSESQMSIQLLDKDSIQKYISKGFRYVHFGCVQIATKPLVRLGIDVPVMLALRDKSLISIEDSLLALTNSNCRHQILSHS
ncbi:ORF I: Movement protein [Bienertia sinuspersici]